MGGLRGSPEFQSLLYAHTAIFGDPDGRKRALTLSERLPPGFNFVNSLAVRI